MTLAPANVGFELRFVWPRSPCWEEGSTRFHQGGALAGSGHGFHEQKVCVLQLGGDGAGEAARLVPLKGRPKLWEGYLWRKKPHADWTNSGRPAG